MFFIHILLVCITATHQGPGLTPGVSMCCHMQHTVCTIYFYCMLHVQKYSPYQNTVKSENDVHVQLYVYRT